MDHIPFGDTAVTRCRYYRRVCDLPAVIDPPHLGRIVMPTSYVWAIMMPTELGVAVKAEMQLHGVDVGAVLAHPRSNRWTHLVRPDLPDDDSLFGELFRADVSIVGPGGTIVLPSPADESRDFRRWIEPPHCIFRPSGHTVLEAIRSCRTLTARQRRTQP